MRGKLSQGDEEEEEQSDTHQLFARTFQLYFASLLKLPLLLLEQLLFVKVGVCRKGFYEAVVVELFQLLACQ